MAGLNHRARILRFLCFILVLASCSKQLPAAVPPPDIPVKVTVETAKKRFIKSKCGNVWQGFSIQNIRLRSFDPAHPVLIMTMVLATPRNLSTMNIIYHSDLKIELEPNTGNPKFVNRCYYTSKAMLMTIKKLISVAEKSSIVKAWIQKHDTAEINAMFQWYCTWEKGKTCNDWRIIFTVTDKKGRSFILQWPK